MRKRNPMNKNAFTAESYYETVRENCRNVSNIQHILVAEKAQAEELLRRVKNGEDFGRLAEAYSICPSGKASKGVLGFAPWGMMVPPFEAAAKALTEIGELAGPVKSQFGYHILKLVEKKDLLTLEECRPMMQSMADYLNEKIDYPAAEKKPVEETFFGITVTDDYRWMENPRDPEVLQWVDEENKLTDKWFGELKLEEKIRHLKSLEPEEKISNLVPCKEGFLAGVNRNGNMAIVQYDREMNHGDPILARYEIPGFTPYSAEVCPCNDSLIAIQAMKDGDNKGSYILMNRASREVVRIIESVWFGGWSSYQPVFYVTHTSYDDKTAPTTISIRSYSLADGTVKTVYEETGVAGLAKIYAVAQEKAILLEIWDDFSNWRYISVQEETGAVHAFNPEHGGCSISAQITARITLFPRCFLSVVR